MTSLSRLLLSLCLFAPIVHAEKPAPEYDLTATGQIEIGPDGAVHALELDEGLPKSVRQLVDASVAKWKFEPVTVNGRAVIARTRLTIQLAALPAGGDDYRLEVESVHFGTPQSRGNIVPPRYPQDALRAGFGARVLLHAKLDAHGKVVAVHPYQTSLSKGDYALREQRYRSTFEAASIAAVKTWQYDVGELVDGEATGITVVIPVDFAIVSHPHASTDNLWRRYIPGPISPAPWVDSQSVAATDTDSLPDGSAAAVDSRFKLISDVIGKTL